MPRRLDEEVARQRHLATEREREEFEIDEIRKEFACLVADELERSFEGSANAHGLIVNVVPRSEPYPRTFIVTINDLYPAPLTKLDDLVPDRTPYPIHSIDLSSEQLRHNSRAHSGWFTKPGHRVPESAEKLVEFALGRVSVYLIKKQEYIDSVVRPLEAKNRARRTAWTIGVLLVLLFWGLLIYWGIQASQ